MEGMTEDQRAACWWIAKLYMPRDFHLNIARFKVFSAIYSD